MLFYFTISFDLSILFDFTLLSNFNIEIKNIYNVIWFYNNKVVTFTFDDHYVDTEFTYSMHMDILSLSFGFIFGLI